MPASICPKCNFNNPPGMRFCGNCGARLSVDTGILQSHSPLTEHLSDTIGVMMGADLMERFRKAGLEASGQRRSVTILFVDLAGFTAYSQQSDEEDTYILIQEFINLMVKDVYKYEGMVDKFLGDGLMAIFGAPIAHENNADLAIRAALDMQADAVRLGSKVQGSLGTELRLHIGLHSGPVVVGKLGTNMLMNYTAIGDTVNLAYRLVQNAPAGAIYASASVYQQTQALVEFASMPPLTLKGMSEPVPAYTVLQLREKPGSTRGIEGLHAPLIGRTSELNRLRKAQEELLNRQEGRVFWIQGEAGIGKSRLVTEFSYELEQTGLRCLVGHCYIYRRSLAYWLFVDLIHAYLALPANASEAALRARLAEKVEWMGAPGQEALPYLEHMLSLAPSNADAAERMRYLDAAQLRQQVFIAVRDLLTAETHRNPLVLVFEDLHWADETSLDLLRFMIDAISHEPLLVIAVTRPSTESPLRKVIERADRVLGERFILLLLQNLSPRQSERMVEELLEGPDLPDDLSLRIVQHAAGNPFYLEEIVRMLIDDKMILPRAGRWSIAPGINITSLGVPDTLQGLILARFDRLGELYRRTLQVASVIGRDFGSQLLQEILSPSFTESIPQVLAELVARGFLQRLPNGDVDHDFHFTHSLVSDAIYSTLLKNDRSELHGRVAEAIEHIHTDHLEEQAELLARHYALSDRAGQALHYLILAGQKSALSYANEQARQQFELALEKLKEVTPADEAIHGSSTDPDALIQIHTGLGDVLTRIGDYPAARVSYQTALEAVDRERPQAQALSSLQRKIGSTYERQGEYAQALCALSSAQAALEEVPQAYPAERAWILNDTGWIYFRRGELEASEKALLDGLRLVEEGPYYDIIASIYNRLGGVYYQKDQLEQATDFVRKSLFLRQEIGDANAVARSYNNLGLLRWKRGDWDSALDDFMRSLKLHANLGDVEGTIELRSNLGLLQLDRGNFEEAQKHLETGLAAARQIGHTYHIGLLHLHFSRLYTLREDWEKSLDYSQRGIRVFNEIGVLEYLVDLNTYLGQAWLGLGDVALAQGYSDEALRLFDQMNSAKPAALAEDRGRALRLLGQVALAKKQPARADQYCQEAEAIFKATGNQVEQGRTATARAAVALAWGDGVAARLFLNQARLVFRQLGARVDLHKVDALFASLPPPLLR